MLSYVIYDVFTETPFQGNPLAIVEAARPLTDAQMQTIARQFNLSETLFLFRNNTIPTEAEVRIFTPTSEIPFAGHPTIGCAIYLAGDTGASDVVLYEGAGPVPVTLNGTPPLAEFTTPTTPAPIGTTPSKAAVAGALGLSESDMGGHRTGSFEAGPAFLYAQVASRAALRAAKPQEPGWSQMLRDAGIDDRGRSPVGLYVYTVGAGTDLKARMFAPDDGIPEDPATGSATAILAAQLLANGAIADGQTRLTVAQGDDMGRPSRLRLTIDVQDGRFEAIRVAGTAVRVAQGQIVLP